VIDFEDFDLKYSDVLHSIFHKQVSNQLYSKLYCYSTL